MPSPEQIARFKKYVNAVSDKLDDLKESIETEEWDGVNADTHQLAQDASTLRAELQLLEDDDA